MSEPVVARIGDIEVTATSVRTPVGIFPVQGTTWDVSEQWVPTQRTPTWAVVLSIVGFCVLTIFSLLFLLVKETVYRGEVVVTVRSWTHQYATRILVADRYAVQMIHEQVATARRLAAIG